MIQSKKYILTGLLGLLGVGIAAYFMMHSQQLPASIDSPHIPTADDFFSHVPDTFDQLVYLHADAGFASGIAQFSDASSVQLYKALLEEVDVALLLQYESGEAPYALLFLEGENIQIDQLKELGLLFSAEDYHAKQLSETMWLYGSEASLKRQQDSTTRLSDNDLIPSYFQAFSAGNYNLGLISQPANGQGLPLIQQYADALKYTTVMTRLQEGDTYGTLTLQFADGIVDDGAGVFVPKYMHTVDDATILYIELFDLLGFFGIGKQQFLSLLPILLGEYGNAYTALLSEVQYNTIYESLAGNIGLIIGADESSPWGVQASIVIGGSGMYDITTSLSPVWHTFLESMVGSGSVDLQPSPSELQYTINSPAFASGQAIPALSIKRHETQGVLLSILGGEREQSSTGAVTVGYNDHTKAVFRINNRALETLSSVIPGIPSNTGISSIAYGIVAGNIHTNAKDDQLKLDFTIQND